MHVSSLPEDQNIFQNPHAWGSAFAVGSGKAATSGSREPGKWVVQCSGSDSSRLAYSFCFLIVKSRMFEQLTQWDFVEGASARHSTCQIVLNNGGVNVGVLCE
jgi:hypothetical protein